jgi:hypothetical protein
MTKNGKSSEFNDAADDVSGNEQTSDACNVLCVVVLCGAWWW